MKRKTILILSLILAGAFASPAAAQLTDTQWTEMGRGIATNLTPVTSGQGGKHHQSGRAWQLQTGFDPSQNGGALWVGSSQGGLWKSILNSDHQIVGFSQLADTLAGPHTLGSFVVHRLDPARILVGPGAPTWGNGDGNVYKTTDEGVSWKRVALPGTAPPLVIALVNRLVETGDAGGDVVLAATSGGIFRSTDFGDSWTNVFVGAKSGTTDDVTDMMVDGASPSTFYAADATSQEKSAGLPVKILRSTDDGISWHSYAPTSARITGSTGRIHLAPCASDVNVIYALATTAKTASTAKGGLNGVYRSLDRGQSWTNIFPATTADITSIDTANQGAHTGSIACDPTDPSHIIFGIKDLQETFDARRQDISTINFVAPTDTNGRSLLDGGHGDYNDILFRSDGGVVFTANDGGIYIYHPDPGGAPSVDDSLNLLGIDALELTPTRGGFVSGRDFPEVFLAGLQDNGVVIGDSLIDPTAPTLLIAPGDGGDVTVNAENVLEIGATSTLFQKEGAQLRSRSTDLGFTWTGIDGSFAGSAGLPRLMIDPAPVVTGDKLIFTNALVGKVKKDAGVFFKRLLDNSNWALVGPPGPKGSVSHLDHTTSTAEHFIPFTLVGDRRVYSYRGPRGPLGTLAFSEITPKDLPKLTSTPDAHVNADRSPFQPATIYYTSGLSRSSFAYVLMPPTDNFGPSVWRKVIGNLPRNMDYNRLVANPSNLDELFLASSDGIWRSEDGGVCWTQWSRGLRRNEVVLDLVINAEESPMTLYAATQGRGFWGRAVGAPPDCTTPSDVEGIRSTLPETGGAYLQMFISPEVEPDSD